MKTNKKVMTTLLLSSLCVCTMVSGVTLMASAETTPAFEMTVNNVASIRLDAPTGIRFSTTVKGDFTKADGYTFGMLVYPQDKLDGAELTHEVAGARDIVTKAWVDELSTTERDFNSVLSEIPEEAAGYGRMLTARAYYAYNGEYTYSDTTITRSIAQTASYLLNSGETNSVYSTYVNAVAESVSVDVATLNMVVGGKETVVATTSPADYKAVWTSDNEDVATVDKDGVVTAVANGTANIVATFGEYTATCFVTVSDYVQGEMLVQQVDGNRANPATYTKATSEVGGRTDAYLYQTNSTATLWNDKLEVAAVSHSNGNNGNDPQTAMQSIIAKAYSYITFDFYMESGSWFRIGARDAGDTTYVDNITNGGEYTEVHIKANSATNYSGSNFRYNPFVTIYARGTDVPYTYAGRWYTAVVDYSPETLGTHTTGWTCISLGGVAGNIYFDNVRYYSDKAKCDAYVAANTYDGYVGYDGSEFVMGRNVSGNATYVKEAVGDRTGSYKFSPSNTWNDIVMIYETGHYVGDTSMQIFADATTALNNIKAMNYQYITFDFRLTSGSFMRINALDSTGVGDNRDDYTAGSKVSTKNSNDLVTIYDVNGNALADTDVVAADTWYTIVVDYSKYVSGEYTMKSGAWSVIRVAGSGTIYLDNVRYYSANPIGA